MLLRVVAEREQITESALVLHEDRSGKVRLDVSNHSVRHPGRKGSGVYAHGRLCGRLTRLRTPRRPAWSNLPDIQNRLIADSIEKVQAFVPDVTTRSATP